MHYFYQQYSSSGGCASTGFSIGANMPQPCASSPAHTNFHALAPSACPSAPCGFTQPQTAPYPAATNLPYPSNQAPSFTASNPTLNSASSIQIGHAPGYPSEAFQGYQSVSIQPPTFSADIAFPGRVIVLKQKINVDCELSMYLNSLWCNIEINQLFLICFLAFSTFFLRVV